MWERTDDVTAGVTKTWSPIGAPETLPACEAFRTEQFVELEAGDYSRKIVGATVVETWKSGSKSVKNYICLPDTVEPRGPKGK